MMGSPGKIVVPHRKPGEKEISAPLFRHERVEDDLIETAVEIAAAVKQTLADSQLLAKLALVGRTRPGDERLHFGVRREQVGKYWKKPIAVFGNAAALHVQIKHADEFAGATAVHHDGLAAGIADYAGSWHAIMGMAAKYSVDPADARGHLQIDIHAIVRQDDDGLGAFGPRRIDRLLHVVVLDAEGPLGNEVARMGYRRIGHGLADDGDFHAVHGAHDVGFENRIAEIGGLDVLRNDLDAAREILLGDLLHTILAEGAFPMQRHEVDAEQLLGLHHVLPLRPQGRTRALPRVAAVEQQRAGPRGAKSLDQCRDMSEAAGLAVDRGIALEIEVSEGVRKPCIWRNPELFEKCLADNVRGAPCHAADAKIDVGLAEIDRPQLRVTVGDVQKRNVAEGWRVVKLLCRLFGTSCGQGQRHACHACHAKKVQKFPTIH